MFKGTVKGSYSIKARLLCATQDVEFAEFQQIASVMQTNQVDMLGKVYAGIFLKHTQKIGMIISKLFCHIFNG